MDLQAEYLGALAGLERQVLRNRAIQLRHTAKTAQDARELYAIEARLKELATGHDRQPS